MEYEQTSTQTSKKATIIGSIALMTWAVEPVFVSSLSDIPIFQTLSIVFTTSFLFSVVRVTIKKRWSQVWKQPPYLWLIGVMGICGSDFTYFFGAQYAPIAHIDLIDFIWPCMLVLFTGLLPKEKLTSKQLFGTVLAASAIWILISSKNEITGINWDYVPGYLCAIFGTMLWGGYAAFSRHLKQAPTEMVGLYCGLGAPIAFVMHLSCETSVVPSPSQLFIAIATGIVCSGAAYQLWDYSIKHGNIRVLSLVVYVEQFFTTGLLVALGKEPLTGALVIAAILSVIGVYLTGHQEKSEENIVLNPVSPRISEQQI